eukprot:scaffold2657_cov89-Amphora_coffeaeformis.AAC.31
MSRTAASFLCLLFLSCCTTTGAFDLRSHARSNSPATTPMTSHTTTPNRRSFLVGGVTTAFALMFSNTQPAHAIPMISTEEFRVILQDSAQAIKQVEFSGPKSEIVTVKLVDGTSFGINDVIESAVDPRSPLKIQAMCRENLVATKFTTLEAALTNAPKKKKLYTNERVQIAAEKERARQERIEADEADRLTKLYAYELEEAKAAKSISP